MANDSQQEQQLIDNAAEAIDRVLLNMGKKTRKEILDNVANNSEDGKEIKFLLGPAGKASEDIQIGDEMIDKIQKALEEEKGTFSKNGKLGKDPHWKKIGEKARKSKGPQGEKTEGSPEKESPTEKEKSDNPNANAQQVTPGQEGAKQDDGSVNKQDQKEAEKGAKDTEGNAGKKPGTGKKPPTIKGNEAAFKKMGLETGMKTAGGAVQGATGTALKAAARPIAAAIVGAGWPVIAVIVVILIILFAIGCAAILLKTGKLDSYTASLTSNRNDIFLTLAASKLQTLTEAMNENIDEFIKNIKEIKTNASGKNKGDIEKLCDKILNEADLLKALAGKTDEGSAGMKEELKNKILDMLKELVKLAFSEVPCLYQPDSGYCGQTSSMMIICSFNPTCGININSTTGDYAKLGSGSTGSSLAGLLQRNIPERQVVQVNNSGGTNYEPLREQAKLGNPVVIGSMFPPLASYMHYMVVTGYAGEENGVPKYYVNNPWKGGCQRIVLSENYFKEHPYPGPDYWYAYMSPPLGDK